jgi:hypothetical protein
VWILIYEIISPLKNAYYVPGTVVSVGDSLVNKTDKPCLNLPGAYVLVGGCK